ncbi:CRAL/TRIO domain-containing protein [Sporormia fimetaria CBS 119925]|uniref:CRAL/TRIO domain-containing protein n=1 Tax=Sporormia fimetaria CBS 119925 TaxID=1340428 RepID=A0A6A6V667_9PLEO|nr:CRAL/TRIO domain-containing protein [Sporormia fimetaria CBS 119925]
MASIQKTPFEKPAENCTPTPPNPLTPEQQTKYDQVLTAIETWDTLPKTSAKNAETAPLSDSEKQWLTRECLLRYLRATKWNSTNAIKRVQETLVWRREYNTEGLTADYISEENATGKQVLLGYDNEGRPCLYLLPNKQNTNTSPKQVQHLVYMLERTLDIAPPGQETLALLIDFRASSARTNPGVATAREVLHILQNHYPERLGRALVTHLPWYVTAFLKLVGPFIDPVTKTKIRYNEPLPQLVPASQLMKVSGGDVDFEYDHSIYWPALTELAATRRRERKERWEKAGKHIGESEVYLWGGDAPSVGAQDASAVQNGAETSTKDADEVANGIANINVNGAETAKATEETKPATETVQPTTSSNGAVTDATKENGVTQAEDDKITPAPIAA